MGKTSTRAGRVVIIDVFIRIFQESRLRIEIQLPRKFINFSYQTRRIWNDK